MAGPLRPPNLFARNGIFSSGTIAIAFTVLIATIPSAPPSSAATANEAMSWTFGESFGKTGKETASLTARVKSRTAASSSAISVPRPFACGHDRFSSIAWPRGPAGLIEKSGSKHRRVPKPHPGDLGPEVHHRADRIDGGPKGFG